MSAGRRARIMKQILKSNGSLLVGDSYVKLPDDNVTVLEPNECVIFRDSEMTYRVFWLR